MVIVNPKINSFIYFISFCHEHILLNTSLRSALTDTDNLRSTRLRLWSVHLITTETFTQWNATKITLLWRIPPGRKSTESLFFPSIGRCRSMETTQKIIPRFYLPIWRSIFRIVIKFVLGKPRFIQKMIIARRADWISSIGTCHDEALAKADLPIEDMIITSVLSVSLW